jgi:hypothetical protein
MIDQWNEGLEQNNMRSIEFPTVVDKIIPYAKKINPYAEARAWRAFLNTQTEEKNGKILIISVYFFSVQHSLDLYIAVA